MGGGRNKINKSLLTPPPPTGTTRPYPGCIFRVDHTKRPPPERQPTSRLPPNPEPTAVAPRARAPLPPRLYNGRAPRAESPEGQQEKAGEQGGRPPLGTPQRAFCPRCPPARRIAPCPPLPRPSFLPFLPPSAHTKSRRGRLSPGVCAPRWRRAPPIPTLAGRGPCGAAAPPAVRRPGGRGGEDDGGLGRAGGGRARRVPPSLGSARRGAACRLPPARRPLQPACARHSPALTQFPLSPGAKPTDVTQRSPDPPPPPARPPAVKGATAPPSAVLSARAWPRGRFLSGAWAPLGALTCRCSAVGSESPTAIPFSHAIVFSGSGNSDIVEFCAWRCVQPYSLLHWGAQHHQEWWALLGWSHILGCEGSRQPQTQAVRPTLNLHDGFLHGSAIRITQNTSSSLHCPQGRRSPRG